MFLMVKEAHGKNVCNEMSKAFAGKPAPNINSCSIRAESIVLITIDPNIKHYRNLSSCERPLPWQLLLAALSFQQAASPLPRGERELNSLAFSG